MVDDDMSNVGTTIRVSWGQETFTPVKFNAFTVGPFEITTTVREGETATDAYRRGMRLLERMAKLDFENKTKGHIERVAEARAAADDHTYR